MSRTYSDAYAQSVSDPEAFWLKAAEALDWDTPPPQGWTGQGWFAGGRLNTCHNAVDRHVAAGAATMSRSSTKAR